MSIPNLHDEPMIRDRERLMRRWTRRLRDWLNVVLDEPVVGVAAQNLAPEAALSQASATGQAIPSPARETLGSSGPPEAWLKLVQEGAPELLLPVEEGGTPWAGIRAFAGQVPLPDQRIPMVSDATVDAAFPSVTPPRQEPLRVVESAPVRRPLASPRQEEKPVAKPTLIQTLESTITQVFRRHIKSERVKESSSQAARMTATSLGNQHRRIEAASPAYDSSALRVRDLREEVPTFPPAVSREPGKVTLVPTAEVAQEPTVIRQSVAPQQSLPWRSAKSATPAANPAVVSSVRNALQAALPTEWPSRKLAVPQPALSWHQVEKTRPVSAVAPSVRPEIESVRKAAGLDELPARQQQQPVLMPESQTFRAAIDSSSAQQPKADFTRSQTFSELPQITVSASATQATERWVDLPGEGPQSSASLAGALRRLDHLRRLDLEQQGGN